MWQFISLICMRTSTNIIPFSINDDKHSALLIKLQSALHQYVVDSECTQQKGSKVWYSNHLYQLFVGMIFVIHSFIVRTNHHHHHHHPMQWYEYDGRILELTPSSRVCNDASINLATKQVCWVQYSEEVL